MAGVGRIEINGKPCPECGKVFQPGRWARWQGHIVCSKHCGARRANRAACDKAKQLRIQKTCQICGLNFNVIPKRTDTAKYCSRLCKDKAHSSFMLNKNRKYFSELERRVAKYAKRKTNPNEVLRNRINSNLKYHLKNFNRSRGTFSLLPYTVSEAVEHFQQKIEEGCVICSQPIKGGWSGEWHVAHLIPTSFAKSESEVIQLFALDNMACAHPTCNIRLGNVPIKRGDAIWPVLAVYRD